jgi:hypothetical protein
MRVEITEKRLRDSGFDLTEGDTLTVPDAVGKAWCDNGWAKDVAGSYKTGERKVTGAELQPAKARHASKGKVV